MAALISGSFNAPGVSASSVVNGAANLTVEFGSTNGIVELQRSFDGSAWQTLSKNIDGHPAQYRWDVNSVFSEVEVGVQYRFECIECDGVIAYRVGQ